MRFVKVFLTSFSSLIGAVGIILGIMYLVGSFNILAVSPKEIHFELNDYYVDDNFKITITSSTEDVTLKRVTLSLNNQDGEAIDGFITDGIIIVPQNVTLNTPFQVKLTAPYSEELEKNWTKGGTSLIIASSESRSTIDTSCNVFVDVPVDRIEIDTYLNDSAHTPITSFALGESFYAEAKFYPASSMYKYSTSEIKKVFFSINKVDLVAENQSMINAMKNEGKPYVYGYDVLKISDEVVVNAHAFYSAKVEDNCVNLGLSEDDLIRYVKNPNYGRTFSEDLVFTNRTVKNFEISQLDVLNTIKFNNISYIYANDPTGALPNLGIKISASDLSPLQNKISDVGIRPLVKESGVYREAKESEIIFTENNRIEFAENISGQGNISGGGGLYFKNTQGDFVLLSTEISERYSYNGVIYSKNNTGAYLKLGDNNFVLITSIYGTTYDKYYFPTLVSSNVDNSFWTVIAQSESVDYFFEIRLFEKGDIIQTPVITYITTTKWKSDNVVPTNLHWADEQAVQLTFIDSVKTELKEYAEYKLSDNIEISNLNSTYTVIRYLAFTTNDTGVDEMVQNAQPTAKYDLIGYNLPYALFEIEGNILKILGDGTVCVIAVIIKTDYLGRPLINESGKYIIFAITKPINAIKSYQELVINIDKTVQDLSVELSINDSSTLKNRPEAGSTEINKIAFVQNQSDEPVFTINIRITADDNTDILKEIELFINAWNQNKIYLQTYTLSGILVNNILHFEQDNRTITSANGILVGTAWTLPINVYTLECNEDKELYIKLIYEMLPDRMSGVFIKKVNLPVELNDIDAISNGTYMTIEVYDGKAFKAGFAVETSSANVVEKTTQIVKGESYDTNSFYASEINTVYMFDGENITETILDENGTFVINFYDKYKNEITISPTDYTITSSGTNKILSITNYSSALTQAQLPLVSTLHINETDMGQIIQLEYNEGRSEGDFTSFYKDITEEYKTNNNYIVKITRYGAGESVIQLLGSSGLLKIEYVANDGTIYELQNVIKYNFTTLNWQSSYIDYLSLSADNRSISVLKTIGTDIILNIIADTGLGSVVYIELTIKPNISLTYQVASQPGASDYIYHNTYYGIFSDNNVNVTISLEMVLLETFFLKYYSDAETPFLFDNGSALYTVNNTLEISIILTVYFKYFELGMKTIELRTDTGNYDFKRNINLNVNANLELVDADDNKLSRSIEFSALDMVVPVLTSADYKRILGTEIISSAGISLEIISGFDIFEVQGFGLKLASGVSLNGTYFVILNVKYGNEIIGQINLSASTNMKVNTLNPDYDLYFAEYNGITHLVLISGKTYNLAFITFLFDNVNSANFNPLFIQDVYEVVDYEIIVDNLDSYTSGYYLCLYNSVGTIIYPVLFMPFNIGFLYYDVDTAENPQKTAIVNSDMGLLLNTNYLIENQVADAYNSGTEVSLINVNYSLNINDNNYSFKNLGTKSVYLLKHLTGTDEGYYYIKIEGIGVYNTIYNFTLSTLLNWIKVEDVSIVSPVFRSSEQRFIGVFNSSSAFSEITLIEQDKTCGLSLELYNNASIYSYKIINEINGVVNLSYIPTSSDPKYASYAHDKGLLKTESLTENHIVWLVISKSDRIIVIYRIFIIANSSLNIYYPHGNGIGISANEGVVTDQAEYVYFKTTGNIVIDFNQNIASSLPNSLAGQDIKRVMFQYGNESIGWTNATNYSLSYSIHKITVNDIETKATDWGASETFNDYLTFNSQNRLTLKYTTDVLVIYVKVTAQIEGQSLNATVYYKIVINYSAYNYALYYVDGDTITGNKFTLTSAQVNYGGRFDFSNVALINEIGSTLNFADGLKYYFYSAEGKDLTKYVNLDITSPQKTISIDNDVELVSDLKVHLIMYTMYGTLIDIEITFKSSINFVFDSGQTIVIYNSDTGRYEIYSDIIFDLTDIFYLETNTAGIPAPASYWRYSFDDGVTYFSGEDITFGQVQSGIYTVTVKVLLSEYDNMKYKEDYITNFKLQINGSIISNYPDLNLPLILIEETIEYPRESNGEKEFKDLIYTESISQSLEVLFSIQNLDVLERYEISAQVRNGNEYASFLSLDMENNAFTLKFNSPITITEILLVFTLLQGNYSITAYLSFYLQPDLSLEINYPSPDGIKTYDSESCYLSGDFINNSNQNNVYNPSNGKYTVRFEQTQTAYFKTTRMVFKDNDGKVVDYRELIDTTRVVITVSSVSPSLVVCLIKGTETYLNENIEFLTGALLDSSFFFQWASGSPLTTGWEGLVTFSIFIDGMLRGTYSIEFYSDITSIFSIELNAHNQMIEGTKSEVFFVERNSTGNLFSKDEALLSFALRSDYITSLLGKTQDWEIYLRHSNEDYLLEKITINASISNVTVALRGEAEITLDKIFVVIKDKQYIFDSSAENSIFTSYVNISNYKLTYRAKAFYMGDEISYDRFAESITFDSTNAGSFSIDKGDLNAIDTPKFVDIAVGGVKFAEYSYILVYDFKISEGYEADNFQKSVIAGTEIKDLLGTFSITRYDGSKFTADYFNENENALDASVIMITDSDYETNRSTDNIKYLNSTYIGYYNPDYVAIASQFSNFVEYLFLSAQQYNNKTYNFNAMPNGAENKGNYIYIIITFKANGINTHMAYAIVKVFISPVWCSEFYNSPTYDEVNDIDKPLKVYYDGDTSNFISTITLSDVNSESNFINIYRALDTTTTNYAARGFFNYIIQGELEGYIKLLEQFKQGNYYTSVKISNSTNTAIYGDKSGYIKITDAYGFVMKYYIMLDAQSDESLSYNELIVNANNAELFEGSTISIVDNGYNQDIEGPIKTNYGIKILNLFELIQKGFSYKVTYSIDNIMVENYNTDIHSTKYNTGKIPVQKASFYTSIEKSESVVLKIQLDISNEAYSETIIINANIKIIQRYMVIGSPNTFVRDAVPFNVSDYVYVRDRNISEDVGEIALSNKQFTLLVPKVLKDAVINVSATLQQTKYIANITVGKDSFGNNKDDSYDNYYYPLIEIPSFKDLNFNSYKFTVSSVKLPNDAGIYLSKRADYSFSSSGEIILELNDTQYLFYNSLEQSVAVVYTTGIDYFYKTFSPYVSDIVISTASIVSSWTKTNAFGGASTPGFKGIYSTNLSVEYTGEIYNNSYFNMLADKLLSVTTLDLSTDESVCVVLNNQVYQVSIPFYLNFDGIRNISVYEAILNLYEGNVSAPQLHNITKYEKDNNVMSVEDLQKLKGIVLYNDTLSLKIVSNMSGITMSVRVYYNSTQFKTQFYDINNNRPHYFFISINSILGDDLGLDINGDYKVEITYTLTNVQSGQEAQFINNVELVENFENTSAYEYNEDNAYCTYTITINSFKILPLPLTNGLYADSINVLHAGDFTDKVKPNVKKHYLIKYSKDNVVYPITINYNVTPQYFAVDTSGTDEGNNTYKVIYANQYIYDETGDYYTVDYDIWTAGYNLLDKSGKKIKSVTSAEEDLCFVIQTTNTPGEQGTSTGAAELISNNKIKTTTGFNPEQHYIRISIYAYVDKDTDQKVFIGSIYIKIDTISLYASVPGRYNIMINSQLGASIYTINTPYTFTSNTVKIEDVLANENMESVVENEQIGFFTGTNFSYRDPKYCTFSVATVISSIDESVFEDGRLSIKINLNETQNSIGQRIEMKATALPLSEKNDYKVSNSFFLAVNYQSDNYYLNYQNAEGETLEPFAKGKDGYFNVRLRIEEIFSQLFVGSDYLYKIEVIKITNESQTNSLSIIYADIPQTSNFNETIFFQISYNESEDGPTFCKFVGLKYTEEIQRLSGPLGYAIDLQNLFEPTLTLKNCTVSFICSFNLNCIDGEPYNLLLSYGNLNMDKTYSIAYVSAYSSTMPFWVEDYAKSMLGFSTAFQIGVSIYKFETINKSPTFLLLESGLLIENDRYFGIYNFESNNLDLFGIKPTDNGYVFFDVSAYASDNYKISIKNYNPYVSLNVSQLFDDEDEIFTHWQSKLYNDSMLYTATKITKQPRSLFYNEQNLSLNQYRFEYAPGYWQGGTATITLIENNLNLIPVILDLNSEASYYFNLLIQNQLNINTIIKGSDLNNVDITAIINNYISNFNGTAKLTLLNIEGVIDEEGLYKFAVYDADNFLILINTAVFESFAGTNYFLYTEDILTGNFKAVKIGDVCDYQLPISLQMTYYKLTDKDDNSVYYAVDANQTATIQINCENLDAGQVINFTRFTISIPTISLDSPLFLILPFSPYSQVYIISNQSGNFQITVPAGKTLWEIDLSAYFDFAPFDLVITADS